MSHTATRWRSSLARRALFQAHLWLGIGVGLYICLICLTGAALVFRIDLQRALHPDLLLPTAGGLKASAADVLDALRAAYPASRIVGVDAPTTSRPVYLAYVSEADKFRTVLIDPYSGRVLGELPDASAIRVLQDLHFDLLAGSTGRLVNGVGAICLLGLCLTGLFIWWQGRARWKRGLGVRWRGNPGRRVWELHGAVGFWTVAIIVLWGVTALSFTFPNAFRGAVRALSPLTANTLPVSAVPEQGATAFRPDWRTMISAAEARMPGQHVARVVLPSRDQDVVQVLFTLRQPTPAGTRDFEAVYLDQFTGRPVEALARSSKSAGDLVMEWVGPLHVGSFGGPAVKAAWFLLALAPPLLFVTGALTWWRRVLRPQFLRQHALREST